MSFLLGVWVWGCFIVCLLHESELKIVDLIDGEEKFGVLVEVLLGKLRVQGIIFAESSRHGPTTSGQRVASTCDIVQID
jgi:hypothetical protein